MIACRGDLQLFNEISKAETELDPNNADYAKKRVMLDLLVARYDISVLEYGMEYLEQNNDLLREQLHEMNRRLINLMEQHTMLMADYNERRKKRT